MWPGKHGLKTLGNNDNFRQEKLLTRDLSLRGYIGKGKETFVKKKKLEKTGDTHKMSSKSNV